MLCLCGFELYSRWVPLHHYCGAIFLSYLLSTANMHGTLQLYYNYGLKDSCLDFNVVLSVTLEYYTRQTELLTTLPAGRIAGRGLYV